MSNDGLVNVRTFTRVIAAGASISLPGALDGFRITDLTAGASLYARLDPGGEEFGDGSLFAGFKWGRKDWANRPSGLSFRNAGAGSITVKGAIWVGGDVSDDRISGTVSSAITDPLKVLGTTESLPTQALWTATAPDVVNHSVVSAAPAANFNGTSSGNIISAGANLNGILLLNAYIREKSGVPTAKLRIYRNTVTLAYAGPGQCMVQDLRGLRLPAGAVLAYEWTGHVEYVVSYRTL